MQLNQSGSPPHSNLLPRSLPYHNLQRLLFEWFFFRYDCFSKDCNQQFEGTIFFKMIFDFQGLGYSTLLYFLQEVSRAFQGVAGFSWACFFFGWRLFDDMNSWTMRPGSMASMALGIRNLSAAYHVDQAHSSPLIKALHIYPSDKVKHNCRLIQPLGVDMQTKTFGPQNK